jgi:predicted CoA-binding protein
MDQGSAIQRVVVLGASPKPDRYSNKAVKLLLEHGHAVVPVHPAAAEIEGLQVAPNLPAVHGPVDTLTVYLSPAQSNGLLDNILTLEPGRVIFNPGTESPPLKAALAKAGIRTEEACTLVLLNTGQF